MKLGLILRYSFLMLIIGAFSAHSQPGDPPPPPPDPGAPTDYIVQWLDLTGVTESNDILTKTATTAAWTNGGAIASNVLQPNTDGWIEYEVTTQRRFFIGFALKNIALNFSNYSNSIHINDAAEIVSYENSTATNYGVISSGDILRISREGSEMKYYRNGVVFRTLTVDPSLELVVRGLIYYTGKTTPVVTTSIAQQLYAKEIITGSGYTNSSGAVSLTVTGGREPYEYLWSSGELTSSITGKSVGTYQVTINDADGVMLTKSYNIGYKVSYIEHYSVTELNGKLTKVGAAGWTAGAGSANTLSSNTDGSVEFTAESSNGIYTIGFGKNLASFDLNQFRYAIEIHTNGQFYYAEGAANVSMGTWSAGDVFRLSREGSAIKYYKNGILVRNIAADPTLQLAVKTSVHSGTAPAAMTSFPSTLIVKAQINGTESVDGTGSIQLTVQGGVEPYTYNWSNGQVTSTLSGVLRGAYTVTVSDAEGRSVSKTYNLAYRSFWIQHTGVTESNGKLTHTGAASWTAGANSANLLAYNANGWMEFTAGHGNNKYAVGFTTQIIPFLLTSFDNAISIDEVNGTWETYVGTTGTAMGTFNCGDVFRIERTGTSFVYYRNNVAARTVTVSSQLELRGRAMVNIGTAPIIQSSVDQRLCLYGYVQSLGESSSSGKITVTILNGTLPIIYNWSSGEQSNTITDKEPGAYTLTATDAVGRSITRTFNIAFKPNWTGITNATVSNAEYSLLQRTGSGAWDAGAVSASSLPANTDGWVEFVSGTASQYVIGFATNTTSFATTAFTHSIRIHYNGYFYVNEGATQITAGTWQMGDIFKVSREGSQIKYYKNGIVFRTIAVNAATVLKTKASIYAGGTASTTISYGVYEGVVPDLTEFNVLKDIYNNLAGAGWLTKTNWPTSWDASVSSDAFKTWFGVVVVNGDITELNLPFNNLSGVVPASIANLAKLKKINFASNKIYGALPALNNSELTQLTIDANQIDAIDLSQFPNKSALAVTIQNNKLDFEDIESYFTGANTTAFQSFTYAPQADIGTEQTVVWKVGPGTCVLNVASSGLFNHYQWQKRNDDLLWDNLVGATAQELSKDYAVLLDKGVYRLAVTNDKATKLTLYSKLKYVKVEDITTGGNVTLIGIPEALKIKRDGTRIDAAQKTYTVLTDLQEGEKLNVISRPPCLDGNYYIAFELIQEIDADALVSTPWDAQLAITLIDNNNVKLWTQPLSLKNRKLQTLVSTIFHDQLISCDQNFQYEITRKAVTASAPEEDIKLKIHFYKDKNEVFDPSLPVTMSVNANTCQVPGNEVVLGWTTSAKGVKEFDVEWVFIAGHENFSGTTSAHAPEAFAFKEPVRITTNLHAYKTMVYYPNGTLWYRIRAIGEDPLYPGHRINGNWSYPGCGPIPIANHEDGKNWQAQTVYAEEGKSKKIMNYFDGTLRQRQTLTNLNEKTVTNTLVAETFYDFEGRKSVDVMAVPSADSKLTYKSGFNIFDNGSGVPNKADYDNGRIENKILAQTVGAGKYYSPANDRLTLHKNFIPDAEGYAYSQTEYVRDGTGRVSRQSGVGEEFKIDGPHATRYFYGNVTPEELVRLFGSNAGKATHYKKNLIVDPNGQVSVSYMDQEDRVIATALAGDKPANVEALDSYNQLSVDPVTFNISSKNIKQNGTSTTTHKLLNESAQTYTFNYDLAAYGSELEALGCQTCTMDLSITVTDPEGGLLDLTSVTGNQSTKQNAPRPYEIKNIAAANCTTPESRSVQFQLLLDQIGDYTITKTVTVGELSFEQLETIIRQKPELQARIDELTELFSVDATDCEICQGEQTDNCPDGEQVIEETISEIATQDCENIMFQILNELEPISPDVAVTQEEIEGHPLHCHYLVCTTDKESDVFEKQLARVTGWGAAMAAGYHDIINDDPFFNTTGLNGLDYKDDMQAKIDDIIVATINYDHDNDGVETDREFRGTLMQVTDPANQSMYITKTGETVSGKHVLYMDLMSKRATIGEEAYQAQLDKQRWVMYKSFYLEGKRLTKLMIPAYADCPAARKPLDIGGEMNGLRTEEEIIAFGKEHEADQDLDIDDPQMEITIYSIESVCNATFTDVDKQAISDHLRTYFNSHKQNFFRVIIVTDLQSDPSLVAIENIISKSEYGCSLTSVAVEDPLGVCVDEVSIYLPDMDGDEPPTETTTSYSGLQSNSTSEQSGPTENPVSQSQSSQSPQPVMQSNASFSQSSYNTLSETRPCTGCPFPSEWNALLRLYESTGGPSWKYNYGWSQAFANPTNIVPIINWKGVATNSQGSVTSITLEGNNLTGFIPEEVGDLQFLTSLNLGHTNTARNLISGGIPTSIGNLQNLVTLSLTGNLLTGSIPASLGTLNKLQNLYLSINTFTDQGLDVFGTLVNLSQLELTHCNLKGGIPASFANLTKLTDLKLNNNKLSGLLSTSLQPLLNLPLLAELYLAGNSFTDKIPSDIGRMTALRFLILSDNPLTGPIPPEMGNLINLHTLHMNRCRLTGEIPTSFQNLSQLSYFEISSTNPELSFLTGSIPDIFGSVNALRVLNLEGNNLSGSIPVSLRHATNLQWLYLSGNDLSGGLPPELGQLTQLTELRINNNLNLGGSIPPTFGNLARLSELEMVNCGLTGKIPSELGNLTLLTHLILSDNDLTDRIPSELGNLKNLTRLHLAGNGLTGTVPQSFSSLLKIQYIDLKNNSLSDPLPILSGMPVLTSLDLALNGITGSIPREWAGLKAIVNLTNNKLSGNIPFDGYASPTVRLYVQNNQFTFANLYPAKNQILNYSPQARVDEVKQIKAQVGQAIVLSADIDRDLSPTPSRYQWFKIVNGVHTNVNSKSYDGHTYTTPVLTEADHGVVYYYKIWNDGFTRLELTSNEQTLDLSDGRINLNLCLGYDTNNPTLNAFFYSEEDFLNNLVNRCMENAQEESETLINMAISEWIENEASTYYNKYKTNCLEKISETLTYTFTPKEYHYTLYYYDQASNLIQTVPPNGVKPFTPSQVTAFIGGSLTTNPPHELVTKYKYNSLNQIVWQQTPDAGESKFWYNEKGQLRLSQNAQQAIENNYSFTKYDEQGRIIEVGEMSASSDVAPLLAKIDDAVFPLEAEFALSDITRTHYDFETGIALPENFSQNHLRTRVAWVEMLEKDRLGAVATFYDYDIHGNVRSLLQQIPGLDFKRTDYVYDLVSGKVNYVLYQYGYEDQFIHQYTYDADNRIVETLTSTDGFIWDREANYYYYLHGPLGRVELGEYGIQGQDYYYTLQGWIKGVNMPYANDLMDDGSATSPFGKDAYAFTLGYYEGDYKSINPSQILSDTRDKLWLRYNENIGNNGLYNGNISWMATDLADLGKSDTDRVKGMQAMTYGYDQLHRIVASKSLTQYDPASGFAARTGDGAYDEDYNYDPNGNILTLKRRDEKAALKDDWQYDYYAGTNRLKKVKLAASVTYEYDAIGNLVKDNEEGTTISWTPYGKVHEVLKNDGTATQYRYDAAGNRVERKLVKPDVTVTTHYVRDASGNVMAVYNNTKASEHNIYGSSRLGSYTGGRKAGERTLGQKSYELSNHLGNVLAVITDNINKTENGVTATVLKVNDYYPFGLDMPGRTSLPSLEEEADEPSSQSEFPGLISAYPLDGDAKDGSGHGTEGVVTGAVLVADNAGNASSAYTFDGNDYITLPNTKESLSFIQNTHVFTITAFIKVSNLNARSTIFGTLNTTAGKGFCVMYENLDAEYGLKQLRFSSTNGITGQSNKALGAQNTINDNEWHHLAVVGDGKTVRFYVDGLPDGTAKNITLQSTGISSENAMIGATPALGGGYATTTPMRGAVDELFVFNRPLTQEEVQKLAQRLPLNEIVADEPGEESANNAYRYGFNGKEKDYLSAASIADAPVTCITCGELRSKLADFVTANGADALLNIAQVTTYLNTALSKSHTEEEYQQSIRDCGLVDFHLSFNGASYINFGDQPQYKMGTSDFTLEAWVKYPVIGDNGVYPIIANQDYLGQIPKFTGFNLCIVNKKIYLIASDGSNSNVVFANTLPAANVWHHIVAQRVGNRASDYRIFVDGIQVPLTVETQGLTDGDIDIDGVEPLKIGSRAGSYDNTAFKGEIKQVRIYKRQISDSEIAASYNYGCSSEPADKTQLVLWAPMDEGKDMIVKDLSAYEQSSAWVGTNLTWKAVLKNTSCVNGQEKVLCVGSIASNMHYDYGFRVYNPSIGRFLSEDPLTPYYPSWSPYPFAMNRPIDGIDLDGLEYKNATQTEVDNYNQNGNGTLTPGTVGYVYETGQNSHQVWTGEDQWRLSDGTITNQQPLGPISSEKITFNTKAYNGILSVNLAPTPNSDFVAGITTLNLDGTISTLSPNDYGLVQFPDHGPGFARYTDANGANNGDNETYTVNGVTHHTDGWASPETAVAFYNAIQDFGATSPGVTIHYGDISAFDPSINLGHSTHYTGNSIDIHYFDSNGGELRGNTAYANADVTMTNAFFTAAQAHGFSLNYSYGNRFTHQGNNNHAVHKDHFHIGR